MASANESYIEAARLAFAIYCDDQGLTHNEGTDLADELTDALVSAADDRPFMESDAVPE